MQRTKALVVMIFTWLSAIVNSRAWDLPFIKLQVEDHFELGFQIGKARYDSLKTFFEGKDGAFQKTLRPFYETNKGKRFVDTLFETSQAAFPKYMDELRGLAKSTNIPLVDLFIQNCESEIGLITGAPVQEEEHCTDVLANSKENGKIIGHNEDYSPEMVGHVFLLDATVRSSGESFVAFIYPGTLAGWAFGFNRHGIVTTANAVFPKIVGVQNTVPVVFSTRYALSAKTPDQAIRMLHDAPAFASSGIGLNVGSTRTLGPMVNIELSSQGNDVAVLNKPDSYFFHFNQYSHHPFKAQELPDPSSHARNRTVQALLARDPTLPLSEKGIRRILGDTSDKTYPIFRSGNGDNVFTLATAIFNLNERNLRVFLCNPIEPNCTWSHYFELPKPIKQNFEREELQFLRPQV